MNNIPCDIPHLKEIDKIREMAQEVYRRTNIPVYDISHWNCGKQYKDLLLKKYINYAKIDALDYHYSYEYSDSIRKSVIYRLLNTPIDSYDCVFIHTATAAICCISDYIKKNGYKKICVLEPAYFSISSCLLSFGLNIQVEHVVLDNNNHCIFPYDEIVYGKYDVVWITSPVFSTGIYYTQDQIQYINRLIQNGILLIIDESAASPNHLLTPQLLPADNIISLFSPHKYLSINSIKFAVIMCSKIIKKYFEDWIDVFSGSLPSSACAAIEHFLSPNYIECLNLHDEFIDKNITIVKELCTLFPDNFYNGLASTYITVQNRTIPYMATLKDLDLFKLMQHTHISFVPGFINGFSKQWYFCYRINLTHDSEMIKSHLGRLFNYLSI